MTSPDRSGTVMESATSCSTQWDSIQYGVATPQLLQYIRPARPPTRRGAGAVERGGLENR